MKKDTADQAAAIWKLAVHVWPAALVIGTTLAWKDGRQRVAVAGRRRGRRRDELSWQWRSWLAIDKIRYSAILVFHYYFK